jgi:Transglutaminase-like superfamily
VRELSDLLRIAVALPQVEVWRLSEAPGPCLQRTRARGARGIHRSSSERDRLRRLIGIVDRFMPGGANCYRRALVEMALDPAAAAEPMHFGLRKAGGPKSGHAWLPGQQSDARYDAEFSA